MTDTTISTDPATLHDLADELHESGACRYCNRDPYHRVDIGVGMEVVAVVCCEAGVDFYQYGRDPDQPTTSEFRAAEALRAIAAEKEAQAAPRVYRPGESLGGGLVAVPEEPTEAMYAAACDPQSIFKYSTPDERGGKIPLLVAVHYRAMLAALTEKGERS